MRRPEPQVRLSEGVVVSNNPVAPDNIERPGDLLITMANAAAVETPAGKTDKLSLQGRIDWALSVFRAW